MAEVDFETVLSEEVKFGTNNFLEIAKKKAITSDSENEFISISRGFFTPENDEKRFRKSIAFPVDSDVVDAVIEALKKVSEGASAAPKEEDEPEADEADEKAEEASDDAEDEKA